MLVISVLSLLHLRTLNLLTNGKLVCADTPVPPLCYYSNIMYTAALKHYDCITLLTLMAQLYIIKTHKCFEEDK